MTARGDEADWAFARSTVRRAVLTSFHCAIASRNPDGSPHVTPIGSLLLDRDSMAGIYFDVFNVRLARNVDADPRVTVLAVDTASTRWFRALFRGRFDRSPGVRLIGTVGPARRATPNEAARFRRAVGLLGRLPGGRVLWRDLTRVRDVRFDSVDRVRLGALTSHL